MSFIYKILSLLPLVAKKQQDVFSNNSFKEYSAMQLAQYLGGIVDGNASVTVRSAAKIEEGKPGTLTFLANPKYTHYIYTTNASIVIVNKTFKPEKEISSTLIRVDDAYSSFAKLLELYQKDMSRNKGISRSACISRSATIGKNVFIGHNSVVGEGVVIGDNTKVFHNVSIHDGCCIGSGTTIYSNVVVTDDCVVGNHCMIHPGAIIGSDGFGFAPIREGGYMKIPQTGNVILEDNVEIGANATIDRATMGSTVIKKGSKLDNLIQIGHNCEIGEDCVIAGQTGISGSTKIGRNAMIGGQTGIVGHIKIGNNVKVAAKSGIMSNLDDNSAVMGAPSFDARKYMNAYVHFKNICKLADRVNELEKTIAKKNP